MIYKTEIVWHTYPEETPEVNGWYLVMYKELDGELNIFGYEWTDNLSAYIDDEDYEDRGGFFEANADFMNESWDFNPLDDECIIAWAELPKPFEL